MKVGLLHYTAPPIVGGVEAIIERQAIELARRGHHVLVVAGRGGQSRRGVRLARLPLLDSKHPRLLEINRALRRAQVPADFDRYSHEVESALEPAFAELDACIVHNALSLHFNLPLTAALHRMAANGTSPALLAWCHDLSWTNPLYTGLVHDGYPWRLLKTPAERTSYVVVSEDRRDDLARLAGLDRSELAVIPAGVDLVEKWALGAATRRLLAEYELLAADPFLLLPVRITRRKNIEFAIRIVGVLRDAGRRPVLLVTGPRGPHDPASIEYVRALESLVGELDLKRNVILLQTRPGASGRFWRPSGRMMNELYRAADLMLMPSAQEGFGIPLIEAGVVGLPIFCSDIPPFREIAGRWAGFFDLADTPASVADEIRRLLDSDPVYNLRKRVMRDFTWDAIFDGLVPRLDSAVARHARPTAVLS